MSRRPPPNPYVGLRPFLTDDARYFFGRDAQVEDLLAILGKHRFLAVVGGSGSGKSSLVRAGLIPMLHAGFLVGGREKWRIATLRPGAAPMRNFAEQLARAFDDPNPDPLDTELRLLQADAAREFIEPRLAANESVLIVVDQFEELFAFRDEGTEDSISGATAQHRAVQGEGSASVASLAAQRAGRRAAQRAEAGDFVDLLLGLVTPKTHPLPVFVVLTMRSDFLGDCDVFLGLPEAMNESRYLVPRLTREQLRQAIEGPALLHDVEPAARLVDRLLNELGDRDDRLPVLQHALQRTWDVWVAERGNGPLDVAHLDTAGGLETALEKDAQVALEMVDARHAELVFRALTETDLQQRRVRRSCRISELMTTTGLAIDQVRRVVDAFRDNGRNFLFESTDGRPEDKRVTISHESLIRQWPTLTRWIDDEARARDGFVELRNMARLWKQGQRELMWGRELEVQQERWRHMLGVGKMANAAWAARYAAGPDDFGIIEEFLERSEEEVELEKRTAEVEERNAGKRRRNRRLLQVGVPLLILAIVGVFRLLALRDTAAANRRAELALVLASIRDLAETDPTMAAGLVAYIPIDAALSWTEIAALRTIADADVAKEMRDSIVAIAVSKVGSRFAMLATTGEILLWPSADSARPATVPSEMRRPRFLALDSAGSKALVTDSSGRIRVVGLDGSRSYALAESGFDDSRSRDFEFPPIVEPIIGSRSTRVLGRCDRNASIELCLWTMNGDSTPMRLVTPGSCNPVSADLHPDGRTVLVGCWLGEAVMIRVDGVRAHPQEVYSDSVGDAMSVSFSRDGRRALFRLASFDPSANRLLLWEVGSEKPPRVLPLPERTPLFDARFNQSGTHIVGRSATDFVLWDVVETGPIEAPRLFAGSEAELVDVRFSVDGTWVAATSLDGTARVVRAEGELADARVLKGHGAPVDRALFTHDGGYLLTIASDGSARAWSMVHDPEPFVWRSPSRLVKAELSANGRRLALMTSDARLLLLELLVDGSTAYQADGRIVDLELPVDGRFEAWFDRDTLFALTRANDSIHFRLWGPEAARLPSAERRHALPKFDNITLATGGLSWTRNSVAFALRRDGSIVSHRHADSTTRSDVWSTVSPDGSTVLSYSVQDSAFHYWSTKDGSDRRRTRTPKDTLIFAPSAAADSLVAAATRRELMIVSGADSTVQNRYLGYTREDVSLLQISDRGDKVAAAFGSGAVSVWDPGARRRSSGSLDIPPTGDSIVSMKFTSDAKRIMVASPHAVRIFTIDADLLIQRIKSYSRACVPIREWVDRLQKEPGEAEKAVTECEARQAGR